MEKRILYLALLLAGWLSQSCSVSPPTDQSPPKHAARQIVAERVSAVVVTDRSSLSDWFNHESKTSQMPGDSDCGSAVPISADGYFLTADHVLERAERRNVFLIYGQGKHLALAKARVVWRSGSSDLALLHIPNQTPYYYQWTSPKGWLPIGNRVIHGGISTGPQSGDGKLGTALAPESLFTGTRKFKIDIPLQPGDSGGPVVDAYGHLVGINSAVEFLVPLETAFFIDSEGSRPNIGKMDGLIKSDRAHRRERSPSAE
jgi:S1-C subfamily serine protease